MDFLIMDVILCGFDLLCFVPSLVLCFDIAQAFDFEINFLVFSSG
jgi:hypothetical protein